MNDYLQDDDGESAEDGIFNPFPDEVDDRFDDEKENESDQA